jgi:beta-glucosidase
MIKNLYLFIVLQLVLVTTVSAQSFKDTTLPINKRMELLINELSLEEKVSLMENHASAIDRLGITYSKHK